VQSVAPGKRAESSAAGSNVARPRIAWTVSEGRARSPGR
jgi:hypothetical protein